MDVVLWIGGYLAIGGAAAFIAGWMGEEHTVVPLMLFWPIGIPLVGMIAAFEKGEKLNAAWRERQWEKSRLANSGEK